MMECPDCKAEMQAQTRKEKYKCERTKHKLAINVKVFICPDCQEIFVDEKDQRIYQARLKNYNQKIKNSLN